MFAAVRCTAASSRLLWVRALSVSSALASNRSVGEWWAKSARPCIPLQTSSLAVANGRSCRPEVYMRSSTSMAGEVPGVTAVYVTVPNEETAKKLSHALVSERLAACVNIVPGLTSVYWWEGKVNEDAELLLMIKTQQGLLQQLTDRVKTLHPYDECEVVALPVVGGSPSYLQWVVDSTTATPPS